MTAARPSPSAPAAGPGELPDGVYRDMAMTLRAGLGVALVLLAGAFAVLVARDGGSSAGGWVSPNPLVHELDPRVLGAGLAAGSPLAYLTLGVYALIATPVVRVATGLYSFYRNGESALGAITTIVLAMLLVGLLLVGPLVR